MLRKALLIALMLLTAPAWAQLQFWAVTGSLKDVDMYKRIAADFTRKTGIGVDVTSLAWGNFQTKYFAAMAAGLPPDVGLTNLGGPFDYGSVGGLVDLRAAFPKETKELESHFNQPMLGICTVNGKLMGVPADLSTLVLYYRTDLFQTLGLKPPKTWAQLNEVIDKLESGGYRYYYGFTWNSQWALGLYTLPFDKPGFRIGADGLPEVLWNDPKYQEGVLEALNLWFMHNTPGQDLGNRIVGMFRSNNHDDALPMFIEQHNVAGQIHVNAPELEGKWDMAPWPFADDGKPYNINGGCALVIFQHSRRQKEAMQWMLYLNTPEVQKQIILDRADRGQESSLFITPIKEVWTTPDPDFWSKPALLPEARARAVVAQVFPTFNNVPAIQGSSEAGRLEANLLDQMNSFIQDRLNDLAQKNGVSKSQLIQRFAAGSMASVRASFRAEVAARLKSEYAKVQPQAQDILRKETARYEQRYGEISRNLAKYEKQASVLDVVKVLVGALLVGAFLTILIVPRFRKHGTSYAFVAAPIVLAVVFIFVPAIVALYLSFTDYHPVLPLSTARWVGAKNYGDALSSGDLTSSLWHTLYYSAFTLPIGIGASLVLAYLLNNKLRGQSFWRFLHFSPLVTSVVSVALIFTQLFLGGKQGWLNALLLGIGAIKDPIPFLSSDHTFLNCVIILAIWQGLAFSILVFLAGLQQVPQTLFEAAAIDGANPSRRFWQIALPGIRPQIFFITVLGIIGSFQVFEIIYVLANKSGTAGARFGPNDSAMTMVPLIYHTGFETFEMGKAAAYAYILFVLLLILTAGQFAIYKRGESSE